MYQAYHDLRTSPREGASRIALTSSLPPLAKSTDGPETRHSYSGTRSVKTRIAAADFPLENITVGPNLGAAKGPSFKASPSGAHFVSPMFPQVEFHHVT